MPLFTQAYSGNSSDKETIVEAMKILKENIEFPDDVYFIADSSLYSEDNIKALKDMKWITCVTSTLNLCKELLTSDLEFKQGEDPRYSFYETMVEYGGIKQKWIVVHSAEMHKRKEITFEKKIKKIVKEAQKELKLKIPKDHKCFAAMTLGYPSINLHSIPERKVDVTWIELI